MAILPSAILRLIDSFSSLPGIGPKTAARLVFFLVRSQDDYIKVFIDNLESIRSDVAFCKICHNLTSSSSPECAICRNNNRNKNQILIVEDVLDLYAFERTSAFNGVYHVLGGLISPMKGIGPDQINIQSLIKRIENFSKDEAIEIIIATNPSLEGEATGMYLKDRLHDKLNTNITRLARGLPSGADLDYADQQTLQKSLEGRSAF